MSHYQFTSTNDSVKVKFDLTGRSSTVKIDGTKFVVYDDQYNSPYGENRLWDFATTINDVSSIITMGFQPGGKLKNRGEHLVRPLTIKFGMKQIAKALSIELKKLHIQADPDILVLDRAIFKAYGPKRIYRNLEVLYEKSDIKKDRAFFRDCCKYRAATIALIEYPSADTHLHFEPAQIGTPFDWRSWYSYSGTSYPELEKTLESINYSISGHKLVQLQNTQLTRPLLTRAELLLNLTLSIRSNNPIYDIILNASYKEIKSTIRWLRRKKKKSMNGINLRKSEGYETFLSPFHRYTKSHTGNFLSLAAEVFK